jgi:hypothetical protein
MRRKMKSWMEKQHLVLWPVLGQRSIPKPVSVNYKDPIIAL